MNEFKKLGLSDESIKALEKKGFTKPTFIQTKVIPLLLEGKKDIVGQSQTGTGKTAAFALPILEKIKENSRSIQAIILTPTRELAIQVAQEISSLKGEKNIKILSIYGGTPLGPQRQKLKEGVDIVVGTPGRIMDLQKRKSLNINNIKYAILDEADEMLNRGFIEDIESILQNTPKDKNVLLFSATMPKPILRIAQKYMREYELFEVEQAQIITETVEQIYYDINARDRIEGLRRIIDYYPDFHGIIFCNTKASVDTLTAQLTKLNYKVAALHGDITQNQREKILQQFKNRYVKILVATDVAARGIDVNDLTHVINFTLPQSPESYVHRIGRTGRAGKKGISITFVIPSEKGKLRFVERINKCKITKHNLPSVDQILKNKEVQIKNIIEKIIHANIGKIPKYNSMAEELLKEHEPNEIISAVLKYSFNEEFEYKNISEIKQERTRSEPDKSRFRRDRKRSNQRSDRSRFKSRSGERRSDKPKFRDRPSEKRSERKPNLDDSAENKKSSENKFDRKEKRHKKSGSKHKKRRHR